MLGRSRRDWILFAASVVSLLASLMIFLNYPTFVRIGDIGVASSVCISPILTVVGIVLLILSLTGGLKAPRTRTRPAAKSKSKPYRLDPLGRVSFLIIMLLIPLMVSGILIWTYFISYKAQDQPQPSSNASTRVEVTDRLGPFQRTIVTTTMPMTPTTSLPLGAFDPGLGVMSGIAVGHVVVLTGAIIEAGLLLVYGAFYVNNRRDRNSSLGLPEKTVRVFVLIIVILTLIMFAFLPTAWGENKAVVFLFGLLSTVVGFYYGSRKTEDDQRQDNGSGADKGSGSTKKSRGGGPRRVKGGKPKDKV